MIQDETYATDALVDLAPNVPKNDLDGSNGSNTGSGGGGQAVPPPQQPFQYPTPQNPPMYPPQQTPFAYPPQSGGAMGYPQPPTNNPNANLSEKDILGMNEGPPPYFPQDPSASAPPPASTNPGVNSNEVKANDDNSPVKSLPSVTDSKLDLPELPTVPSDTPPNDSTPDQKNDEEDDLDFDDLTRRFEALKKKK